MYTLHMGKFSIVVKEFSEQLGDNNSLTLSIVNDNVQPDEINTFTNLSNLRLALESPDAKYMIVQNKEVDGQEIATPILTWSSETHKFLNAEYGFNPETEQIQFRLVFGVNN